MAAPLLNAGRVSAALLTPVLLSLVGCAPVLTVREPQGLDVGVPKRLEAEVSDTPCGSSVEAYFRREQQPPAPWSTAGPVTSVGSLFTSVIPGSQSFPAGETYEFKWKVDYLKYYPPPVQWITRCGGAGTKEEVSSFTVGVPTIQGTTWFPIGPAPVDGFFAGGVSGRASAIAVNPHDPDDVWLGTAAGGVWHSTNNGRDWEPTSDKEEALAIGALALDECTAAEFSPADNWTRGVNAFLSGRPIYLADVTGDRKADAISVVDGSPNDFVEVRRSDGAAFLAPEVWTTNSSGFTSGWPIHFADVNGDGKADAINVVNGFPNGYVEVRKSNGSTFLAVENWTPAPDWFQSGRKTYFADLTGDGKADAISVTPGVFDDKVEVRRSDGSTFLASENWIPGPNGLRRTASTYFADVTGDGKADAISVVDASPDDFIAVRRSDGSALLAAEVWTANTSGFSTGWPTYFADVTGDGKADAVTVVDGIPNDFVEVRRSDGSSFLAPENWTPPPNAFLSGRPTFFADVTGDRQADAISEIDGVPNDYLEVRRARHGCAAVYAGTGENAIRRDTYSGAGLLIGSVDATDPSRLTWRQRTGEPGFDFRNGSINDIVLDPTTSGGRKRIFITLSSGVTASASEATVTAPQPRGGYGIYRSDDQGATWTKLNVVGAEGDKPTDLEAHPTNPAVLYAGILGRGIFKTTDGGANWCPANPGIPRPAGCPNVIGLPNVNPAFDFVEIAIAPSNSSVLYATFGNCPDRLFPDCQPLLFRSSDGGLTWSQRTASSLTPGQIWRAYSRYTHALAVDPSDENHLFLGGIRIWHSTSGGQSVSMSDANPSPPPGRSEVHWDCREIVFHPAQPQRVYTSDDGGFATSADGGQTWTPRNDDLQITGFHGLGSSPLTGAVIGASQDNGGQLWNGSRRWKSLDWFGDGGFAFLDRSDVMTMYAGANAGSALRSTDGGVTWGFLPSVGPSEPRLFYAPFIQDPSPPHPLYRSTNRLYRSTDKGTTWTGVSPVLATGTTTEILGGTNAITAIAVAPSASDRIYVGYYGGEVFRSNPAPCGTFACWTRADSGLPDAPITRIAVHPTRPDTAWATVSGFLPGAKVFTTLNGGVSWLPSDIGLPAGVPANTISVQPSAPTSLFVGLDSARGGSSLFRSTDGGARWAPFSTGLPNAPVYEISIDETHGRVYAATHGRGAFVLGRGFISSFEACFDGRVSDLPLFGQNFGPDKACTVQILQANGNVCASGGIDAIGGSIKTNAAGVLVTDKASFWNGKEVVWACSRGTCVGGTPISACHTDADGDGDVDPPSTVVVSCGGELAVGQIRGCADLDNPPSSLLSLGLSGLMAAATKPGEAASDSTPMSFQLTASVAAQEGARSLCTVSVTYESGEAAEAILMRARDAVNTSAACALSKLQARVNLGSRERGAEGEEREDRETREREQEGGEDEFSQAPTLMLVAPGVKGGQLITAIHSGPRATKSTCLSVNGLGIPVLNRYQPAKVVLTTPLEGAAGGEVTLVEYSALGSCSLTIATDRGQSAEAIASAFAKAAQQPGTPGPHPHCPSERNPRDLVAEGDALVSVAASSIELCSSDPNVGFGVRPAQLDNAHPVANAGGDRVVRASGGEAVSVRLDGSASSDPDSTPGTDDDITSFEWYEVSDPRLIPLGQGKTIQVPLAKGPHRIRLRVEDKAGLVDANDALITVEAEAKRSVQLTR